MNKKIALAVLAMAGMTHAAAAPVSQQRATSIAASFLATIPGAPQSLSLNGVERYDNGAYIINFSPGGFVIVSADDNAEPIIGFNTSGNIRSVMLPSNMSAVLTEMSEIVQRKAVFGSTSPTWRKIESRAISRASEEPVEPLISVSWNQSNPYNQFCPGEGSSKALVGCVAVSMSQAMSVQQFPPKPIGRNSYSAPGYGVLTIDYDAEQPYNWQDILSGANKYEEVARLLYHAGVSVNMNYGTDGSGIPSREVYRISNALKANFGYGEDVTYTWRRDYHGDWTQLLLNELYAGRAIIYNASDSKGNYGHSFNIDGYLGGNFHVNWGWGGYGNGYFNIDKLSDSQMGMNYDTGHVAVTGIGASNAALRAVYLPDVTIEENLPAGTPLSALLVNGEFPSSDMKVTITGEYSTAIQGYKTVPFEYRNGQIVSTRPLSISEGPMYIRVVINLISDPSTKLTQGFNITVEAPQTIAHKTSLVYERATKEFKIHTKYGATYSLKNAAGTVLASGSVGTLPEFSFSRDLLSSGVNTLQINAGGNSHSLTITK